ncbi:MAG: AEC family transporter [Anaerolineales bacterium]|nr:AEC family transporter [Anaerolineales bacterium]
MNNTFITMFFLVLLGYCLKKAGILKQNSGEAMVDLILYATLPATCLLSISRTAITARSALTLIGCALLVPLLVLFVLSIFSRNLALTPDTKSVLLASVTATNLGFFLFPYFEATFGLEALGRLAVYDIGNAFYAYSLTYYVAASGKKEGAVSIRDSLQKLVRLPGLWASLLGLVISLMGWQLPVWMTDCLEPLAKANSFLAMTALGVFLNLRLEKIPALTAGLAVRVLAGLSIGFLVGWVLGLGGMEQRIVFMAPAMPIGMVVLIYSAREKLNTDFAGQIISLSILTALVITPLLLRVPF